MHSCWSRSGGSGRRGRGHAGAAAPKLVAAPVQFLVLGAAVRGPPALGAGAGRAGCAADQRWSRVATHDAGPAEGAERRGSRSTVLGDQARRDCRSCQLLGGGGGRGWVRGRAQERGQAVPHLRQQLHQQHGRKVEQLTGRADHAAPVPALASNSDAPRQRCMLAALIEVSMDKREQTFTCCGWGSRAMCLSTHCGP